ncbi:hypothetical protein B0H11DRAFT_2027929 [Mycena galericulata]|nr:hypothetical protein B0H11DRAFT_2027929 [Mycena galericulata]
MLSTIHSHAIAFQSNTTSDKKPRGACKDALRVQLGSSIHVLLDADSDLETPSPLSICFDFTKPAYSPLKPTHPTIEWADSDSDSDSDAESELVPCDDSQYISIPSSSPFYSAPAPPTFRTTFDHPPVGYIPFACHALEDGHSQTAAELFHAELERVIPAEDEERLGAALMGTDVCLARQRPATLSLSSIDSQRRCPDVSEDSLDDAPPTSHSASLPEFQRSLLGLPPRNVTSAPASLARQNAPSL